MSHDGVPVFSASGTLEQKVPCVLGHLGLHYIELYSEGLKTNKQKKQRPDPKFGSYTANTRGRGE